MLPPRVLALVLVGLLAAGCSGGDDPAAPATPAPATPSRDGSGDGTGAGSAAGSGSPSPSATAELPTGCDSLLPFTDLDRALGRPLFGQTSYTRGVPQPAIGRTGRVTCGYGLDRDARKAPPVEVGVSTYTDAESAARRVRATVSDLRSRGATQRNVRVSGLPAAVLGSRTAFTLVLAQGSRTVAVTVQRSLPGNPEQAAVAVTEKVLANLGP